MSGSASESDASGSRRSSYSSGSFRSDDSAGSRAKKKEARQNKGIVCLAASPPVLHDVLRYIVSNSFKHYLLAIFNGNHFHLHCTLSCIQCE